MSKKITETWKAERTVWGPVLSEIIYNGEKENKIFAITYLYERWLNLIKEGDYLRTYFLHIPDRDMAVEYHARNMGNNLRDIVEIKEEQKKNFKLLVPVYDVLSLDRNGVEFLPE